MIASHVFDSLTGLAVGRCVGLLEGVMGEVVGCLLGLIEGEEVGEVVGGWFIDEILSKVSCRYGKCNNVYR